MKYLLILVLFSFTGVAAQSPLRGVVQDASTHTGIEGATVYCYDAHKGAATDGTGQFTLEGLAAGSYLIQVSHVGYENFSITVTLPQAEPLSITLIPSRVQLSEVVVLGAQSKDKTSFTVAQVNAEDMIRQGSLSISDAMSRLPGMSQLTTGVGISKPVIRGLYGNRVQVNVNGLRFDNQQWQDEHGLGLSDAGVEKVEIIKGPSSVLYGSDAMGGVLNIIEERPAPINTTQQDLMVKAFSNTYGLSLNYGIRQSRERSWWRIRAGADSHADYSNPHNGRVLNSRFASYNVKASVGFNRTNRSHALHVLLSSSKFGFVFDSLSRKEEDARLSRSFDGPHHQVLLAQVSSENTFFKKRKKIKINGGVTTNLRQEDEGGGGISLSMLLNTGSVSAQINQAVGTGGEWIYGVSGLFQTNTNYGGRIIVPNAVTGEFSAFTYFSQRYTQLLLEGGLRYDRKFITTRATGNLNVIGGDSPTDEITPFNRFYNAFNLSAGAVYSLTSTLSATVNASTGYRPGNLAELSSNGLHEGTLRWEIGLPTATIEQNLNVEGSIRYASGPLHVSASVYQNKFNNYIYLAPTGAEFYGFNVYHFRQDDATFRGGELELTWLPPATSLEINTAYSFIQGKKRDGTYLPFVPANKWINALRFHLPTRGSLERPVLSVGGDYYFKQDRPSEFETSTPGYFLMNASASCVYKSISLTVTVNNLLNNAYYDHLSRFKYFGIYNMGRMIVFSMNYKF